LICTACCAAATDVTAHRQVRGDHPPEAVFACQFYTLIEIQVRGDKAAAIILGIGKPAERMRFDFRRFGDARVLQ
jgi:hypothetical protein